MGAQQEKTAGGREAATEHLIFSLALGAFAVTMIGLFVWFAVETSRNAKLTDPKYTVAITGAAGLDGLAPAAARERDRPITLSPVFNLTVHINNTGKTVDDRPCIGRFSTASVSYGDAFLARGSVPEFCAGKGQEGERDATAWGQDVVVPRFLRERLAGELERGEVEVDVQVRTPAGRDDVVLACKVKIGGGPSSPCSRDHVARPAPAAAGFTGSAT